MLLVPKLALVAVLIGVLPFWSAHAARSMREAAALGDPMVRIYGYLRTIVQLWLATAAAFTLYRPADLFHFPRPAWLGPDATFAVLGAILVIAAVVLVRELNAPRAQAAPRAFEVMAWLLPATLGERRLWLAVAATAGITEEFLFRGFVMRTFADAPIALPLFVAATISTLGFGINHAYQGAQGIVVSFVLGAIMMLLFAATGNLLVPIVLHALIDARVLLLVRRYS